MTEIPPIAHTSIMPNGTVSHHLPVPKGRRFRFTVVEVNGRWEVQDTENDNKSCLVTINKELAQEQAVHLQPRVLGTRLK